LCTYRPSLSYLEEISRNKVNVTEVVFDLMKAYLKAFKKLLGLGSENKPKGDKADDNAKKDG